MYLAISALCQQINIFKSYIAFLRSSSGMYLTFSSDKSSAAFTRKKKRKKRGSNTLLWWFMSCYTAAIKYMLLITHQHCTRFITNHEQISWRLCCCDLNIPLINFIDKSNCLLNSVLLTHAEDNCKQSIYCPGGPKRT